jgi:hypothetical protein
MSPLTPGTARRQEDTEEGGQSTQRTFTWSDNKAEETEREDHTAGGGTDRGSVEASVAPSGEQWEDLSYMRSPEQLSSYGHTLLDPAQPLSIPADAAGYEEEFPGSPPLPADFYDDRTGQHGTLDAGVAAHIPFFNYEEQPDPEENLSVMEEESPIGTVEDGAFQFYHRDQSSGSRVPSPFSNADIEQVDSQTNSPYSREHEARIRTRTISSPLLSPASQMGLRLGIHADQPGDQTPNHEDFDADMESLAGAIPNVRRVIIVDGIPTIRTAASPMRTARRGARDASVDQSLQHAAPHPGHSAQFGVDMDILPNAYPHSAHFQHADHFPAELLPSNTNAEVGSNESPKETEFGYSESELQFGAASDYNQPMYLEEEQKQGQVLDEAHVYHKPSFPTVVTVGAATVVGMVPFSEEDAIHALEAIHHEPYLVDPQEYQIHPLENAEGHGNRDHEAAFPTTPSIMIRRSNADSPSKVPEEMSPGSQSSTKSKESPSSSDPFHTPHVEISPSTASQSQSLSTQKSALGTAGALPPASTSSAILSSSPEKKTLVIMGTTKSKITIVGAALPTPSPSQANVTTATNPSTTIPISAPARSSASPATNQHPRANQEHTRSHNPVPLELSPLAVQRSPAKSHNNLISERSPAGVEVSTNEDEKQAAIRAFLAPQVEDSQLAQLALGLEERSFQAEFQKMKNIHAAWEAAEIKRVTERAEKSALPSGWIQLFSGGNAKTQPMQVIGYLNVRSGHKTAVSPLQKIVDEACKGVLRRSKAEWALKLKILETEHNERLRTLYERLHALQTQAAVMESLYMMKVWS